jgi:hypothetical protein
VLGFVAYGVSLALFVVALRHLGTARTGAYFSVGPFFGAVLAVAGLGEPVTASLLIAGGLMALGVWLHLSEQHAHAHTHEALEHVHEHEHDVHHAHTHAHEGVDGADAANAAAALRHTHRHRHDVLAHTHTHFPDGHHRHSH